MKVAPILPRAALRSLAALGSLFLTASLSADDAVTSPSETTPDEVARLLKPTRHDECEYVGGVPLGGLGAGTVELRGDGSFREWQIFNNWGNTPTIRHPNIYPGFDLLNAFAAVKIDERACILETHPVAGFPGVDKIDYEGWFPFSRLRYKAAEGSPVDISVEAFGSYVPHHVNDSGLPALGLTWRFKNTSAKAVRVSLALSLVNPLGLDCRETRADHLVTTESTRGRAGVAMAALDGEAKSFFGDPDTPETMKAFWDEFTGAQPAFMSDAHGQRFGQMLDFTLQPGEEKTQRFVVGWYFPDHRENGVGLEVGHQYEHWTDSAAGAAGLLAKRFAELRAASSKWSETLRDSSWPEWINHWLCNSQYTLAKLTWWTKDGRYMTYESPGCANGSPVHLIDLADWPVVDAFPELELRLLRQFAGDQNQDGRIPEQYNSGTTEPGINRPSWRELVDVNTKYAVEIFHRWRETGDRAFLDATWPAVKKAMLYNARLDQMDVGAPSGPKYISTFDHWNNKYFFCYGASVALAGMRAAEELAKVEGDTEFAGEMHAAYEKGLASVNAHLWNGEFYAMTTDEKLQQNDLSFVESTYGDIFARFVGLGRVLPDDRSLATLRAIANYNRRPTPWGLVISANRSGEMVLYNGDKRAQITICHALPAPIALIQQGDANDLENGIGILRRIYAIGEKYPGGMWNLPHHVIAATGERGPRDFPHYMRDRAIWALLKVLNGWSYDAPDRSLDIGPVLNPEKCRGPWICSTAYGTLAQAVADRVQKVTLSARDGVLELGVLNVRSRIGQAAAVNVTQDGVALPIAFEQKGDEVSVKFNPLLKLAAGSAVEIMLAP